MATTPFVILTGNCKIGASAGTAVDVKDAVTAFTLRGARSVVEVPATLATGEISRLAGTATYELEIAYLGDDAATTALTMILWDALDPTSNPTGRLYFEGNLHGGTTSATNPKWSGTFIATGADFGGEVGSLSATSQTFPLIARPTRATS